MIGKQEIVKSDKKGEPGSIWMASTIGTFLKQCQGVVNKDRMEETGSC